jgi:predicted CoA-binding protein
MAFENPRPEELKSLLQRVQTIAVVGLSPKPARPSYSVARAMQRNGYRIVPVRPAIDTVLDEQAYARLADIPFAVDLVNVFRESAAIPGVVEECLAIRAPALWIQEGIWHEAAAARARAAGLMVVMNRCIWKDYMALMAP